MILTEEKRIQIMSYIVHAWEILQKDKHFPKHLYKYAYLPAWPELYTGTLKAAGYLFLDKTLKNMILIVEQATHPEDIIGYVNEDKMLIRWNTIENDSQKVVSKIEKIPWKLFDQLLYMRIVTNI